MGGLSMSKEWVLNSALNRWGLNRKRRIGATSEMIRTARPKTQVEWEDYYKENVPKLPEPNNTICP